MPGPRNKQIMRRVKKLAFQGSSESSANVCLESSTSKQAGSDNKPDRRAFLAIWLHDDDVSCPRTAADVDEEYSPLGGSSTVRIS